VAREEHWCLIRWYQAMAQYPWVCPYYLRPQKDAWAQLEVKLDSKGAYLASVQSSCSIRPLISSICGSKMRRTCSSKVVNPSFLVAHGK
jgi:hypothetical protein